MYIGLGRRKEASAKVNLISGTGNIFINKQKSSFINKSIILKPLQSLGLEKNYDAFIQVKGSGINGQIQAIQLGVARAICNINPLYRGPLKKGGFLTRDSRSKERRKYGLKKARKAPQFSKR